MPLKLMTILRVTELGSLQLPIPLITHGPTTVSRSKRAHARSSRDALLGNDIIYAGCGVSARNGSFDNEKTPHIMRASRDVLQQRRNISSRD